MDREAIVIELLKNSVVDEYKNLLKSYLFNLRSLEYEYCTNPELIRLDNCITYIRDVGFDISGWMLREIPVFYAHCFWKRETNQSFELAVWDIGVVIPRYFDERACEQDAVSIQDAIDKDQQAVELLDYLEYLSAKETMQSHQMKVEG